MTTLTIIGAGWLGSSLASYLNDKYTIYASRTTPANVTELTKKNINGFVFNFRESNQSLVSMLEQQKTDIVVGCFPPGFRNGSGTEYVNYWKHLTEACQQAHVKKILMISSTAVYPNRAEVMTEESASLQLTQEDKQFSDKSKILLQAEEYIKQSGVNYCILRMSGLAGPDRHPARFIEKMKHISMLAPANIVHLVDAVKSIEFAIENINSEIINVTTPYTVSKAAFYKYALAQSPYDFELPEVVSIEDKCIISDKLQNLGFQFRNTTTYQVIDNIDEIL